MQYRDMKQEDTVEKKALIYSLSEGLPQLFNLKKTHTMFVKCNKMRYACTPHLPVHSPTDGHRGGFQTRGRVLHYGL